MAAPNQYRTERGELDQSEGLSAGAVGPEAVGPEAVGHETVGHESVGPQAVGAATHGPGACRPGAAAQQGDKVAQAQAHRPEQRTPRTRTPRTRTPRTRTHSTEGRREETRQRILTAAGQLFREHGIDGIGVDAVMQQAGLTHGGFYLHFPSKESLAAAVSPSLLEKAAAKWDEISHSPDRDAALQRIVQHYLDPSRVASAHCCPLTTLGPDVARRSASRAAIGGALRGMLDALARVLPGRRRQAALATLSTMVGAVVLSRLADDPVLADAFLQAAADSILPSRRASNRMELFTEQPTPD
jgi:TetR/AcrR family transcriptional regulator, transcriptional repressor for nem operon